MRRIVLIILCAVLLLAGCATAAPTGDSSQNDVSGSASTPGSSVTNSADPSSTPEPSQTTSSENTEPSTKPNPTTAPSYDGVNRTVLAAPGDLKTDYKRLPDIESITQAQIDRCMLSDSIKVTVDKNPANRPAGATAAIKLEFILNKTAGQVIFAEKLKEPLANGLDEAIVLDPVDGGLTEYEGIRYWVKVKRPAGKAHSQLKIRFFFGAYSYYRSMYEYTSVLPDGDFEGYVTVPFNEMVNGYNGNPGVSLGNIAYFALNVNLEGNAEGLEVYVSDFQAYREMFW